jgi:CheY-like chemotaxis protein
VAVATVLVVEDDPANAQMVMAILSRAGHRVFAAVDGPGGLESARSWSPDVILLDVSLAGAMSGLDVCRTLRADPHTSDTPIMFLSGWAFASDMEAGRMAGANDYLPKPFTREDLVGRVQGLLEDSAGTIPESLSDQLPGPGRHASR